jgi:lactoylglutathione lyase
MSIFKTLGHLALRVNDLDASVAFYNKIGFPEMLRLLNDKGAPWIVYHRITDELYLELFPGGDGETVPPPERTGLMHLCLTVEDIDVAEAELKKVGVELMRPRDSKRGLDGNRGMWIEDPDGHQIEIMEMAPDCIQAEAVRSLRAGGKPQALPLS